MRTSQDGINLIKEFESCELDAYQDSVGCWTIGWGHTMGVCQGMTITQVEADQYLADDLRAFEGYIEEYVTAPLSQHQFDALVSFTYNLGPGTLYRSDVLQYLNEADYSAAADAMLNYDHAGGEVLPGLLRRRTAERALFLTPDLVRGKLAKFYRWMRS
jgi:lysozyme